MEDQKEVEILETTEAHEKDSMIEITETATADVADGKITVKLKDLNCLNLSKVDKCTEDLFY